MSDIHVHLHEWIYGNRTKTVRLLKKLVQEPSIQGNESSAQAVIIEKCRELGLLIDIWEPDGAELSKHPYFVSPRTHFAGSPNVVATLKGAGGGRSMVLNGHIDVVPEGDRTQWTEDPYSGMIKEGKLYGRGSTDMKGGNVSLLLAMEAIQSLNLRLKGDVIFQSVIEEESGGAGTLAAILRGYTADAVLIPEPTNMRIFPKQQGSMWFRITVKGRAAHGGTRYEGVSAIEKSMLVISEILRLEETRNKRITDPLFAGIPIPIPINIGKIEGGTWPSSVADTVTLEGRMGVAPSETMEEAKKEMEDWLSKLNGLDNWFEEHPVSIEWFGARWVPGEVDSGHELIQALQASYRTVKGEEAKIEASPWGTDAGLFTHLAHIPAVVFGPGVTETAHYPNEYIEIERILEAAEIIALTLIKWCELEEEDHGEKIYPAENADSRTESN